MKCPVCGSENTTFQAKEVKLKIAWACFLIGAGLGIFAFGVGALITGPVGFIIGKILEEALPRGYHSVLVCQNCGYTSNAVTPPSTDAKTHPLFCDAENSNLVISRNDVTKGTIVVIRVTVDGYEPIDIKDNQTMNLRLPEGVMHIVSYEQINGIGKKKNRGELRVNVDGRKQHIAISFTRQGLIVNQQ